MALCDGLRGVGKGRKAQEGGDACVITAALCCDVAETNTALQSDFPPIKK